MIISHKHKYLFVEIPHTGSTAISQDLRTLYDGERILHKHATYDDFLKIARTEEKSYFVFAGIRNPLDDVVSRYFKFKTDHRERYSRFAKNQKKKRRFSNYGDVIRFRFIREKEADFPTYFRRFYKIPYNSRAAQTLKRFDFVMRFENLQADFAKALELIGIKPERPLPLINKTGERSSDFLSYYTPEIIPQAKRVFGPYMSQWGYDLPPEWGNEPLPWWAQAEYAFFNLFWSVYWRLTGYHSS